MPSINGAAMGKRPTGPLDSTAATMQSPEMVPARNGVVVSGFSLAGPGATRLVTAAVTNRATVVSSRLPTIVHETTGTTIHKSTGSHSNSRAASFNVDGPPGSIVLWSIRYTPRQIHVIASAVSTPAVA